MKQILFVCRNNKFRSRVAECYFKKINKNKNIKAESAGLFEGSPNKKKTINILKKIGIKIKGKPRSMSNKLLREQDLIVIVADNVPKSIFIPKYVKKVIKYPIKDGKKGDETSSIEIAKKVMRKIDKLNKIIESGELKL
jgi:protein-tyrosine-phosphatase